MSPSDRRGASSASNAAAAAARAPPSSSPLRDPPSPPVAVKPRSRARTAPRSAYVPSSASPPSTPPRNPTPSSRKGKQPLRHQHSPRDPLVSDGSSPPDPTAQHSHGLSWSSATRDSVVDNLLDSLDSLSRSAAGAAAESSRTSTYNKQKFSLPLAPAALPSKRGTQRARSHTQSPSLSTMSDTASTYTASAPGRRSNSSSQFGISHSMQGRMRASSRATRASAASTDTEKTTMNEIREGSVKNKESLDFGHRSILSTSRLGWGRRSVSVDQLYAEANSKSSSMLDRGRPVPSVYSKYESALDAAPEPMVANGPRKLENPAGSGPVYVGPGPPKSTLRKMTTQADLRPKSKQFFGGSIPQDVRNLANDFKRGGGPKGAQAATVSADERKTDSASASQPHSSPQKATASIRERPGFFKRVFGGGSKVATTTSTHPPRSDSLYDESQSSGPPPRTSSSVGTHSKETRQSSKEHANTTSYPPVSLNKKTSAFFRRRKKSISETAPAEPVPNLNLQTKQAHASPSASSLRKVMDPFLSSDKAQRNIPSNATREDSARPTSRASSTGDSDTLELFHSGYSPPTDASLGQRNDMSRSPQTQPTFSNDLDSSPKMKIRMKKQRQDTGAEEVRPLAFDGGTPPKVSPLGEITIGNTANERPLSEASTGDLIIASRGETPVEQFRESDYNFPTGPSRADAREPPMAKLATSVGPLPPQSEKSVRDSPTPVSPTYYSATSLQLPSLQIEGREKRDSVEVGGSQMPKDFLDDGAEYRERAQKIFEGDETDVTKLEAAPWLGETNTLSTRTRKAYLALFDFSGTTILQALRMLCDRLVLRGETQQFDRIITELSARWCECNPSHGFKAQDVVHTICYSLILLNTDLHMADIGDKMSRSAYVKNTVPTIKRVVSEANPVAFDDTVRPNNNNNQTRPTLPWSDSSKSLRENSDAANTQSSAPTERTSLDQARPALSNRTTSRPGFPRTDSDTPGGEGGASNALVNQPWSGTVKTWELEIESILKTFFTSIKADPLPLHGANVSDPLSTERTLTANASTSNLRRSGSVISRAPSDNASYRTKPGLRNAMGFNNKYNRSRPKVYTASTLGSSSRTSFDDGNSVWSPQSSKNSFGRTLTSVSMQSLGQHMTSSMGDFKHSIGFANALSQAIIREETAAATASQENGIDNDSAIVSVPPGLLEDEALALEGAPWAKEGLVKHKHHRETQGKKAKERSWSDCFAVISKGKLTLFAFNTSSSKAHSMGRKTASRPSTGNTRAASVAAPRVGGGDWMENAEQLDVFILRQTIASTLPPPGYSKTRPHVWALSLPSGAVHLFQVGTAEIAKEFMSTANYWSARLSKEPLSGGVSNIEYGWSDDVINSALVGGDRPGTSISHNPPPSIQNRHHRNNSSSSAPRPSHQSSLRGSMDAGFGATKARLPADKIHLADWHPPTQSMMPSQLMEVDQLRALTAYVSNQEAELERHNELKHAIELAYSPRHANHTRATTNWERKSDYLLREIVKFHTYIDSLEAAGRARDEYNTRKENSAATTTAAPTQMTATPEP